LQGAAEFLAPYLDIKCLGAYGASADGKIASRTG
jgi:hypothetical protein